MSKPIIGIVGGSGTGKSTSLRNLDPKTTIILDLERKGLPFKNTAFTIKDCDTLAALDRELKAAMDNKEVKVIVIESITKYFEMLLSQAQMMFKGFDVWSHYNRSIGNVLNRVKNDSAVIVFTAIDEIVKIPTPEGTEQARRSVAVKGKEWEGKVEKEFLVVFFTSVKKTKDGAMEYQFMTNTDGVCSAKSPMDMYAQQYIPNDLAAAIQQMETYYK